MAAREPSGAPADAPFLRFSAQLRRGGFTLDAAFTCAHCATALFGPSGAGKTTILDAIAGLLRPARGEVAIGGEIVFSSRRGIDATPERRGVGYVFQDGALFPHRRVKGNLLYGSRHRRGDRPAPSFDDVVEMLDLRPLLGRKPAALSGGERQRVAIGRAILSAPRLLLLDEPLASLDLGLRDRILPYLSRVRDELGLPFLYVSHAIAEVVEAAEEAVVVDGGRVIGQGAPIEVLSTPEVFPVADRLGIENALEVEFLESDPASGVSTVRLGGMRLKVPRAAVAPGTRLILTVRADEVLVAVEEPRGLSARNVLPGDVRRVESVGGKVLVYLDVGAIMIAELTPEARRELALEPGRRAFAVVKSHSFRVRGVARRADRGEEGAGGA